MYFKTRYLLAVLFWSFFVQIGIAQQSVQLQNLQLNYMHNPVGLDQTPLFSWEIQSSKKNVIQKNYCIKLYNGKELYWSSGVITSNVTNNIKYTGKALQPSSSYIWTVEVSTNSNKGIVQSEKANFETGLLDSGWSNAQWISCKNAEGIFQNEKQTDKAVMFRTVFGLKKKLKSAKIYTTSLGIHDLFINGKRVGTKTEKGEVIYDELKPGWTDVRSTAFYLTYDVTSYLNQGKNAIGAYVASGWASGVIAHNRYKNPDLSYKAKLLLNYTDGTSEIIVTNTQDWKASADGAIRMTDIYAGEDYDARYSKAWTTTEFNDTQWETVVENLYFKGTLTAHIGLPVRERKDLRRIPLKLIIYKGTKTTETDFGEINVLKELKNASNFTLKKGETAIIDFGQNLVGWTPIKVKGTAGTQITLRYAEMLNDSGSKKRGNDGAKGTLYRKNLRKARASVIYTMNGNQEGESYQPSMTWFGFRYAEISADADIEVQNIYAAVLSSVGQEKSGLITSSRDINQLFQNTLWGQRGNFISVPMDCPQRNERMGWMADTQVFTKTALYNSNATSFYQKWMGDVRDAQEEDGAFSSIAPQTWGSVGKGEAAWADAGIIVPYMTYMMTANKSILEENYEAMSRHMDFLKTNVTADYQYNGGGTKFGDWLAYDETDKRYLSVCFYAYDAILMEAMAEELGKTADVQKYAALYQNIKKEFNKRYVTGLGILSQNTQTAYLYALKLKLINSEEATKIATNHLIELIKNNGNKLSTGFLGTAILNQTLSELGESDMAYNLILQRDNPSWLYSIDQGATTIWERWNSYTLKDGFGNASMNSFNHYAYGAVVEWMYAYMAGIRSKDAGFRHIIIEPQLDLRKNLPEGQERIKEVKAQFASVNGMIKSYWKVNGEKVTYYISIPANTTASFVVPINQKSLEQEEKIVVKDNKQQVELGSGNYIFTYNINEN